MDRKPINIEELLAWSYRQELPKSREGMAAPLFGSTPMADYAELATLIDRSPNGFGCVIGFSEDGDADPDALFVGHAVQALDRLDFSGLAGVDVLGDVSGEEIGDDERVKAHEDGARSAFGEDGEPRRRASIAVASVAKLGRRPETPEVGPIRRSFAKLHGKPAWFRMEWRVGTGGRSVPIEVDGYNRRSGRPHKDAYRKFVISPDLGPIVAERIDYLIWRQSLDHLVMVLDGALERFAVQPSMAPRWPWEEREGIVPARVWPSLAAEANKTA